MAVFKEVFKTSTVIVGKKGEILPKKKIREEMGIQPGDELAIRVVKGEMRVNKIPSFEELANQPIIISGTPKYFKELARKEIEDQLAK